MAKNLVAIKFNSNGIINTVIIRVNIPYISIQLIPITDSNNF